jgi:hypothetical protein
MVMVMIMIIMIITTLINVNYLVDAYFMHVIVYKCKNNMGLN